MAITAIYGLDYFRIYNNYTVDNFIQYGKLPFVMNNVYEGNGKFKFTTRNGRMWLSTYPTSSTRTEYTYRTSCANWDWRYSYVSNRYYQYCARYNYATDWSITYDRRRKDSSSRTPVVNLPLTALWDTYLQDNDVRFFTAGVRLWFPHQNNREGYPLSIVRASGDTASYEVHLLHESELPDGDDVEVYFEFTIDRQTGVIRRWLDDRPLSRRTLSITGITNLATYHLQIGGKNTSTSSAAPEYSYFSFNDLYAVVDTSHLTDGTHSTRLGEVEVGHLPLENFLINRFWHPPTEDPLITVNRVKSSENPSSLQAVVGDTHADPATALFGGPIILLDEEIIHVEVDVYAHAETGGAGSLHAEAFHNSKVISDRTVDVPVNNLETRRIVQVSQKVGESGLNETLLDDLKIEINFVE